MIKILIADDHAVVRQGLKQILAEGLGKSTFGEAGSGAEVLELAGKDKWDVVVMDVSMPGRSGLDLLKDLKEHHKKLPVLVLSIHPENMYAIRMLKAGASGYLTKGSAPEELVNAIQKILSGQKYVSPSLLKELPMYLEPDDKQRPHESLSDREYQVMCMIVDGKALKDIGEELSLSVKTVTTYRTRILEKMNLKTNADLIHYAYENKLIPQAEK